jgi:hypothetical protein
VRACGGAAARVCTGVWAKRLGAPGLLAGGAVRAGGARVAARRGRRGAGLKRGGIETSEKAEMDDLGPLFSSASVRPTKIVVSQ